jgi:hypothetical protein
MTPHKVGMINMRDATREDYVTIGNGSTKVATKIGDIPGVICDIKGNPRDSTVIKNVTYVPNSAYNLFSLMKMMKAGWELNRKGGHLAITRGNHKLVFDIEIATPKGTIFAVYMKRNTEIVNASTDHTKMSIQKAHDKLGHMSEALTRKAAKSLNWDLTPGTLEPCESCAAGKARQKNVPKNYDIPNEVKDSGRVHLDIASIKQKKGQPRATKPHWRIIVDEHTQMKISHFYTTKNSMIEPTCELFNRWKQMNRTVTILRMDNAGENKLLDK